MPVERARTDLRGLLDRAEAASPVEAIDVLADELHDVLGANDVCFLITDLGGRAVARFVSSCRSCSNCCSPVLASSSRSSSDMPR